MSSFKDLGKIVNGYLFADKLGKGAYGCVYKACRLSDQVLFAIKAIDKSHLERLDKRGLEFIETEISVMGKICSQHIVALHDSFETDSIIYIVIEYCDQPNLEAYLSQKGQLPYNQALDIMNQLLSGLSVIFETQLLIKSTKFTFFLVHLIQDLHELSVIHRDLKPENIFQTKGKFKIGDFGFAREVLNTAHTIRGTPAYMAPEVVAGKGYDLRADLWSVGVIFYRMLFGEIPYVFKSGLQMHMMNVFKNTTIKYDSRKDIPYQAIQFLKSLLQVDPKKRITWQQLEDHPVFMVKLPESLVKQEKAVYSKIPNQSVVGTQKGKRLTEQSRFFCSSQEMSIIVKKKLGEINIKRIKSYSLEADLSPVSIGKKQSESIQVQTRQSQTLEPMIEYQINKLKLLLRYVVEMGDSPDLLQQFDGSRRLTQMRVLVATKCRLSAQKIQQMCCAVGAEPRVLELVRLLQKRANIQLDSASATLRTFEDRYSHIIKDKLKSFVSSEAYLQKQKFLLGLPVVDYSDKDHTQFVISFHKELKEKYGRLKPSLGLSKYLLTMQIYSKLAISQDISSDGTALGQAIQKINSKTQFTPNDIEITISTI